MLQLGQRLAERVDGALDGTEFLGAGDHAVGAGVPDAGDGGEHVRRTLDGGALHVVLDRADAAEFLAAACAARAAVDQVRNRGTVAGRGARGFAVEHVHAAVVRGDADAERAGGLRVVGADRGDQRAGAHGRQADGVVKVGVADHGADRAEGLEAVHRLVVHVVPGQQQRRHEGAGVDLLLLALGGADHRCVQGAVGDFAAGGDHGLDGRTHVAQLFQGGQGAHGDALGARVADDNALLDALAHGLDHVIDEGGGHDGAADGGALLSGLDRHLGDDGLDEGVEFGGAGDRVGAEDRGVERVGFGGEAHSPVDDVRCGPSARRRWTPNR